MEDDQREVVNAMSSATHLGGYTLDDWEKLEPVEGYRVELVDGNYVVSPAPSRPHQRISHRLCYVLNEVVEPAGLEAMIAVDLRVGPDGYIPDLVVEVPKDGTPSSTDEVFLAVEIVSPSSTKMDRVKKPATYAAAGIPRYWRVEMPKSGSPIIHCHELNGNVYRQVAVVTAGVPVEVFVTDEITVKLDIDVLVAPRQPRS